MEAIGTVFMSGNSQAMRIPKAFRLDCKKVIFRKDALTQTITVTPQPLAELTYEQRVTALMAKLEECAQMPDDGFMFRTEFRANEMSRNVFDEEEPADMVETTVHKIPVVKAVLDKPTALKRQA